MGPVASSGSILLRELPSDSMIDQTNSELKDLEADLEALSELQGDNSDTIRRYGAKLTEVEKKTQKAAEEITQGAAKLSESQMTKSNMRRLGLHTGLGAAGGLAVGLIIAPFIPPVAAIVVVFVTTLGGGASGGMMSLK